MNLLWKINSVDSVDDELTILLIMMIGVLFDELTFNTAKNELIINFIED